MTETSTSSKQASSPQTNIHHQNRLFCFGLGYSASHLARQLQAEGWHVAGTCRSPAQKAALEADGFEVYLFDGDNPMANARSILAGTTHLLSSIPTNPTMADPVLEYHFDDITDILSLKWVGYLSTTGVYGDRNGGWVDETSALEPTGPRGEQRVTAEARWMDLWWEKDLPVHCFRLAGIYGPGKSALENVRTGRAKRINKAGQVFSRIHIDDIAQILKASMLQPCAGQAYNCCDDNPAPPEEVTAYACDLLGIDRMPLISFEDADLSPMARSFYRDNKRVSNQRIKTELGVKLLWPNYKSALEFLLKGKN